MKQTKRKSIDFTTFAMPLIKAPSNITEDEESLLEDFPFDEIANKSKTTKELLKNIELNITNFDEKKYPFFNYIIKLYNKIGTISDEDLNKSLKPWPFSSLNDIVGVEPMTDPKNE